MIIRKDIRKKYKEPTRGGRYSEINHYTSLMLVLSASVNLLCMILNEFGLFGVDRVMFRRCAIGIMALALIPFILIRYTALGNRMWCAYYIITCAGCISAVAISAFAFSAALIVVFPLVIALTYYHKKIGIYGMLCSGVCVVPAWFLSGKLSYIPVNFAHTMIYGYDPENLDASATVYTTLVQVNGKDSLLFSLLLYYVLPNCIILLLMYFVIRRIIKIRFQRKAENEQKIFDLKNQVLTAMSDIVENRDTSTGGHVKRTTDVVSILVQNLDVSVKDKGERYKEYVIKAAATHDLGKIAIDDSILKKPGKLTQEEFEQIKIHPVKSEELINQVLGPIEDEDFMEIARNLAKYHHERYDGKGYPEGLSKEDIPLEARIMAIADVYDALVSKRCYKAPMSHEDACNIIRESMGTQFDPNLLSTFEKSADELKEYYFDDQAS